MRAKKPKTKISIYLDDRTAQQLEEIAVRRHCSPFQAIQECVVGFIKDSRTRVVMEPEHYTARHAEEVITE